MAPPAPDPLTALLADPSFLAAAKVTVGRVHRLAPYLVDGDDLFQETIARGLARQGELRGTTVGETLAWLRAIARNELTDRLRRAAAAGPAVSQLGDADELPAGPAEEAGAALAGAELLARGLAGLTRLERAVLRARYADGMSFEHIARVIGRTPAAVRQMHHRLLERLRDAAGAD